jgi:hypothetical protein
LASRQGRSKQWLALVVAFSMALAAALACGGTSSSTIRPTTGIVVRAETLTSGRGCGRSPTSVFKYAVVVFGYREGPENARASYATPVTANVFDCFTDGAFIELEPVAGRSTFRLEVYAYNEPAYTAARAVIDVAGTDTNALRGTTPTWSTECTATQLSDVQALALCDPLLVGLTGLGGTVQPTRITLGTTSFRLGDGRSATCANASDAGTDASSDAALGQDAALDAVLDGGANGPDADAGPFDAGASDAGSVAFAKARIRYRTPQVVGPTTDISCPGTFLVDVPSEPARYDIDVGLLDPTGTPIGTTVCTVTSQTGATSSAVCP